MQRAGVVLCANISAVADQPWVDWVGGRTALVILASTYPTTCTLQLLGPDGVTALAINASTIAANAAPVAYDLPAGQYRIHMASGTVSKLYANLVTVPYG